MLGVLKNSIPKNIYKNRVTYLLMILFIAVGMYVASSLASITYSYEVACEANYIASNYQDGQFSMREPLTGDEELSLENKGYTLERIFSFDTEIEDGSILRFFKVRKKIDLLMLDAGTYPEQTNEIVLDKCYAAMHELTVGDTIKIDSKPYLITGVGSVTDYDCPTREISDYSSDSVRFGIAFLTDEGYEQLLSQVGSATRQDYLYSYKLGKNNSDDDLRNEILALYGEDDSILTFVKRSNNGRMGCAVYDSFAYEIVGFIIGIGLLILVSVVFYLGVRTSIEKESASIGALYAMGVKKYEVILMYLAPPTIMSFIAGILGWLASIWFSAAEIVSNSDYYCVPYIPIKTSPLIFAYCVLMPPAICFLINAISLNKSLSKPPVALLKGTIAIDERSYKKKGKKDHSILFNLICSRIRSDIGLFFVLFVGSLVAGMIYMLGCGVGQFVGNIQDRLPQEITYEYVYDLLDETDKVPEKGEGVYKKTFKIGAQDTMLDVQFIGLESQSSFFDVDTDDLNGKIILSEAIASREGLKENDIFTVIDDVTEIEYSFTVASIADYKVQYVAFMNINDLRKLLGKGEVYNSVYSDEVCDYTPTELLGSYTREDYINPIESFSAETGSMSVFLIVVAIFFFASMIIYIVRFSISGARRHIAIHSVLGYSNKELQVLFLSSTSVFAFVCGIIGLLTGFQFSKMMVPYVLETTPIGIFLEYSVIGFIRDIIVVIVVYLIAVICSYRQIKDIYELDYVRSNE